MRDARPFSLLTARVVAAAVVVATLAGCGSSTEPMSNPGDKPAEITADAEAGRRLSAVAAG